MRTAVTYTLFYADVALSEATKGGEILATVYRGCTRIRITICLAVPS